MCIPLLPLEVVVDTGIAQLDEQAPPPRLPIPRRAFGSFSAAMAIPRVLSSVLL